MKKPATVLFAIVASQLASSAMAAQAEKKPTVQDWIGGKLTAIASSCVGPENIKALLKKGPIVPPSLLDWPTLRSNLSVTGEVIQGSAGKYMSQVKDLSGQTPVTIGSALSGTVYPPQAVAEAGFSVTHAQNCMTMLAGKANLKLSYLVLQAALDATYSGNNTQALILDGGTMTSAYAWALDDSSNAVFPGIERTEVMLDIWAWLRNNPTYAANDKLKIYGTMSAIEAHLVKDISVENLLKGSASASGGLPFLGGAADGNTSAKVMTASKADGFETAVFSSSDVALPTALALAARLEPRLRLVMDQGNQVWFTGVPVKLTARLLPAPKSACENAWAAENGTLNSVSWEEKTRACRFDVTFSPPPTTDDTIQLSFALKSTIASAANPSIHVSQSLVISNEAAKISFSWVTPSLGALPAVGSSAPMPLTLTYRVAERESRVLDSVSASYPLDFKCGADAGTQIIIKDAHAASGAGTKDVMVSADIPATALLSIAQTPVRCTVSGKITVKSTGTGGTLTQEKTLPTFNFDLVRPSPAPPAV